MQYVNRSLLSLSSLATASSRCGPTTVFSTIDRPPHCSPRRQSARRVSRRSLLISSSSIRANQLSNCLMLTLRSDSRAAEPAPAMIQTSLIQPPSDMTTDKKYNIALYTLIIIASYFFLINHSVFLNALIKLNNYNLLKFKNNKNKHIKD